MLQLKLSYGTEKISCLMSINYCDKLSGVFITETPDTSVRVFTAAA